jgi:hypothetical protein
MSENIVQTDEPKEEGFYFFVPMEKSYIEETLKSNKSNDPKGWKIGGYASSADTDLDGESIDPYGIDTSYFLKQGWFNSDHQKGAEHKVGIPTEAFVDSRGLYVRGYLLKDVIEAQGIYQLMKALASGAHDRKVGFSVEGKVIEQQGGRILKCWVKDIAITANPVNTKTYAELIKSLKEKYNSVATNPDLTKSEESIPKAEIKEHAGVDKQHFEKIISLSEEISAEAHKLLEEDQEEFGKGLSAGQETGNGGPSGQQTGGDALRVQDLENKLKVTTNVEDEDPKIVEYAMKKGNCDDITTALKLIAVARLLKTQNDKVTETP